MKNFNQLLLLAITATFFIFGLNGCISTEVSSDISQCEYGNFTGKEYYVNGNEISLMAEPNSDSEKLINQTATEATGTTQYMEVDSSCKIYEICKYGDWSKIQVIVPDWLKDTHIGWINNKYLKEIEISNEPTKALESRFNNVSLQETATSENLSKADIAWHAFNSFGWDCQEVKTKGEFNGEYYVVTCSSGLKLRVYPRDNQHPKITNINGGYN